MTKPTIQRSDDAQETYGDTRHELPTTKEDAHELNMQLASVRDRQLKRLQGRAWFYAALACAVTTWGLAIAARFS